MNFLFWNLKNQSLSDHLIDLKKIHGIDIFILAEHKDTDSETLREFKKQGYKPLLVPKLACDRITIYYFNKNFRFEPGPESSHYTIKYITLPGSVGFILAMVHLPSKMHKNEKDLTVVSRYLKYDIETLEKALDNDSTIVVGDFNMNPYEEGMINAGSLHSLPCKYIVSKRSRTIDGRSYSMMYNPMWNFFGDEVGPPGTYFYNSGHYEDTFWNMYDQVIIRPSLLKRFDMTSLDILTTIGEKSLVNKRSEPSKSDHLPIKFSVNLNQEV